MAGDLSEKVSAGQCETMSSTPDRRPVYGNYLFYGAGIGGALALMGSCGYCMYDGYMNKGLDLAMCPVYGTVLTTILSHPLAIIGAASGVVAGAAACCIARTLCKIRPSVSSGGLEGKL